jgi:hypothetical protein
MPGDPLVAVAFCRQGIDQAAPQRDEFRTG